VNELSLFTGAGGGVLGTHLLGWTPIGYVEWDDYCQRVIAARVRDGFLPAAPIFGDVREFAQSGAADQYRGFADVVTAGFPCQPFSVAGKQQAADDSRNMWPATAEIIRRVQPRSVLLENVPGLISCGYLGTVLGDLAALGYVGRWGVLGACDAGAPHQRDRLWIVAHAKSKSGDGRNDYAAIRMGTGSVSESRDRSGAQDVAHADSAQREGGGVPSGGGTQHADASLGGWWAPEPDVGRVANGVANGMDRLKAIGNGQVSSVVRLAWEALA
jgi:DNA (cytosine-5)-methyltransferase 1